MEEHRAVLTEEPSSEPSQSTIIQPVAKHHRPRMSYHGLAIAGAIADAWSLVGEPIAIVGATIQAIVTEGKEKKQNSPENDESIKTNN